MSLSLEPHEMDLTFLVEHPLNERVVELNTNNAKGTHVFIEPQYRIFKCTKHDGTSITTISHQVIPQRG